MTFVSISCPTFSLSIAPNSIAESTPKANSVFTVVVSEAEIEAE